MDPAKVKALAALAPQMGSVDYQVQPIRKRGDLPFAPASFDAVLIDAPCSNTGVLRRRVEARWRLREKDIPALAAIQTDLLARAAPLLRPAGRLVFSTCSLEREENEDVVEAFVAAHPTWRAERSYRVWPGGDADGGCAFVLTREA